MTGLSMPTYPAALCHPPGVFGAGHQRGDEGGQSLSVERSWKHRCSPPASAQETQFQVQVRSNGGSTAPLMAAPEQTYLSSTRAARATYCHSARVTQLPGARHGSANGVIVRHIGGCGSHIG